MQLETVEHYRKHLEEVKEKNRKSIAEIERKIDDHESKGLAVAHLYRQLDQVRRLAGSTEKLASDNLERAEKAEAEKEKQAAERQRAASSQIESRLKQKAKTAWIAQGGAVDEFEKAWEAMRDEIIRAETVKAVTEKREDPPIFKNL